MAFIPVPNGVEVVMRFDVEGQEVINTFGVDNGTPASEMDLISILGVFTTWWETDYSVICPTNVAFVSVTATALDTATSPGLENTATAVPNGTHTGTLLPNNVTLAVTHLTDLRGRSYRGRTYLPGLTVSQFTTPNQVAAASITQIINALTALLAVLEAVTKSLVVISRFTHGAARGTGVMTDVTAFHADNISDSQRRRLPGRGA